MSQNNPLPGPFRDNITYESNKERCSAPPRRRAARLFRSVENDLSDYKFKVGQSVLYTSGPYGRGGASVYKVTQLLPSEGDDRQYRIKSSNEPHERVAKESQLNRDS
jgi:hypothetical protein